VHKLTINDTYIRAGTGRICVLPTFLFRPTPAWCGDGMAITQSHVLRAWAAIILELYTLHATNTWGLEEMLASLRNPVVHGDAVKLISMCLNEVRMCRRLWFDQHLNCVMFSAWRSRRAWRMNYRLESSLSIPGSTRGPIYSPILASL
jgi:hypothetical protein